MAKSNVKEENKEEKVIGIDTNGKLIKMGVKVIMPITHDFGREDLNELRDKVNELIAKQ